MPEAAPIVARGLSHYYGAGDLRKQILCEVDVEVRAGEIVIVTGPSGSGKTTLLTLIGALRSAQEGELRVLGRQLHGAAGPVLEEVRRQVGYIFQSHNLIESLTARQNVEMSLYLHPWRRRSEVRKRALEMLEAVGLGEHADYHPSQLSGGERQRVAIARALVTRPLMILADEPTASLDSESGRDVVDRMQALAREQGVTVILVTHDNRILDVADRIVHLEDGRLSSFTESVIASTQHLMGLLAESRRKGELGRLVAGMSREQFEQSLEEVTAESRRFLDATALANDEAFRGMLDEALFAFTFKMGELLESERASIFLVDHERGELWLRVAQEEQGKPVEFRMPLGEGIAGDVAIRGIGVRIEDAYRDSRFNPAVDGATGFHTRSVMCLPVRNAGGEVFAVAELLNRRDGRPFDVGDEEHFSEFLASIGVLLEAWWQMAGSERPH